MRSWWMAAAVGLFLVGLVPEARGERPAGPEAKQGPRGAATRRGAGAKDGQRRQGEGGPKRALGKGARPTRKKQEGEAPKAARGNMFLRQGSTRAAVSSFEKQLEGDPDSAALHIGLAKALTKIGRCKEALDHFWPYVGTKPFGGEAAIAASTCSSRLGLLDDAVHFDRVAVDANPDSARALTNLALDLDSVGDEVGRDAVLEDLLLLKKDRDSSQYARGVLALRAGDLDTLDSVLTAWEQLEGPNLDIRRLQALAWLDQDSPMLAWATLEGVRRLQNGQAVRHIRAESLRRMGYVDEAAAYLKDRPQNVLEGGESDAVRARVAVDRGDLDEARALLAEYDGDAGAEVLGSAWYLARAEGRTADLPGLEASYNAARTSPLRRVEQLVPWVVFAR